ncbi:MAG: acyltransferase family protein, partial [Bacteroidales bacterium]|nr:acyltransferase family protein [Bacteroidales bacterium]
MNDWIYTFHMPLFFIVAGLFLKPGKNIYLKRAKNLLVPYLVFAIVTYIYWRLFEMRFRPIGGEGFDPNKHFWDIFWQTHKFNFNVVLWFLPCLYFTITIANLTFLYIKQKWLIIIICCIWVVIVSLYIPNTQSMW